MKDIVKLADEARKRNIKEYSIEEVEEALREALTEVVSGVTASYLPNNNLEKRSDSP